MKIEAMSELFGKVADKLDPTMLGGSPLYRKTGSFESRGDLEPQALAQMLGPGEVTAGWAMYQSGLQSQIESIPEMRHEALGQLIAAEWCDAEGAAMAVRCETGGRYRWMRWMPGEGQEWLCDERHFRAAGGHTIRYLRLWSDTQDPHGAWRPVSAVFAGFEKAGEQA